MRMRRTHQARKGGIPGKRKTLEMRRESCKRQPGATEDNDPELTDRFIAQKVVKVMEQHMDKPFFIAAGFHKPHVPHIAPKKYFSLYPVEKMALVQVPKDDAKDIPPIALASKKNYQPELPEKDKREVIASYLACVSYMDEEVGVVLATMDRLKLWDNTVVVFMSDHGWHFGEHNWWAKASLFEESAHAPLIVAAPGISGGQISPRVVEYLDIYPTLAEFCGLPVPQQGEGRSFVELLKQPNKLWNKHAFTALNHQGKLGRSVRDERYRYTEWDEGRAGAELYDHAMDPHEYTNLVNSAALTKKVEAMKLQLRTGWHNGQVRQAASDK